MNCAMSLRRSLAIGVVGFMVGAFVVAFFRSLGFRRLGFAKSRPCGAIADVPLKFAHGGGTVGGGGRVAECGMSGRGCIICIDSVNGRLGLDVRLEIAAGFEIELGVGHVKLPRSEW